MRSLASIKITPSFEAGRGDLALLAVGIGAFLTAGTFSQALLAVGRAGRAAVQWTAGATAFVALELALAGTTFHRVSAAFAAGSALVAALLVTTTWRSRP